MQGQKFYPKMLEDDPSNFSSYHQYVKHSYYRFPKICFPSALVIDSSTIKNDEQIVIHVVVKKSSINHVDNHAPFE